MAITSRPNVTVEFIESHVEAIDIFKMYCQNFKTIDFKFASEFRNDNHPSSVVTFYKGTYIYKDFGEPGGLNCFQYVMKKFNLSFIDALYAIAKDFNLSNYTVTKTLSKKREDAKQDSQNSKVEKTVIKVKSREFEQRDIDYWTGRFGVPIELLKQHNILPVSHCWINDNGFEFKDLAYSYNYYFVDNVFLRKIYRPLNDRYKFTTNTDWTVIQGVDNINKDGGSLLIVASSYKDLLVIKTLGYFDVVAPNSETTFLPACWIDKYKQRYKRMVILFDNDFHKPENTGVIQAKYFADKYDMEYVVIPEGYLCKDVAELRESYGFKITKKIIDKLINNE